MSNHHLCRLVMAPQVKLQPLFYQITDAPWFKYTYRWETVCQWYLDPEFGYRMRDAEAVVVSEFGHNRKKVSYTLDDNSGLLPFSVID